MALSRRNPLKILKNEKGVAMIMAITAMGLLTYLAMEIMYDSTVEYTVNSQSLNRLKAYYAARSGADLGLLRIKMYEQAIEKIPKDQKEMAGQYIDEIWRFPITWPLMLPEDMQAVDKDMMSDTVKESYMDASFALNITAEESSKIDLSDLVSKAESLKKTATRRLIDLFEQKKLNDEEWRKKYGNFRPEELINNIADWMSDTYTSANGGDKRSGYEDLNRDAKGTLPPNRGFRTLQELRLVKDMNDDFYDLLIPQVTLWGMRGVNPNISSKEILMSLDIGITSEVADKLIERRNDDNKGGPYKSPDDFWSFATQSGARLETPDADRVPLVFEELTTFRIKSTGEYGGALREIELVVADLPKISATVKKAIDQQKSTSPDGTPSSPSEGDPAAAVGETPGGTPAPTTKNPSKGPPRIVYWTEK